MVSPIREQPPPFWIGLRFRQRTVPQLSMISNQVQSIIYENCGFLIRNFAQAVQFICLEVAPKSYFCGGYKVAYQSFLIIIKKKNYY